MATERLRVLHVLEALEGGTARHVRDLVVCGTRADHVVVIPAIRPGCLTDTEVADEMRAAGADVRIVDMRRSTLSARNAVALVKVWRIARQVRPSVIHGHSSIGGVVARLVGRMLGIPAVWTPNGVLVGRFPLMIERGLSRWTAQTIAVSRTEAELIGDLRLSPPDRVATIPNGLAPFEIDGAPDVRAMAGIPAGAPLVGCVARLVDQKGIDIFLEMVSTLTNEQPDAYAVLIGTGPLEALAKETAQRLDRFRWLEGFNGARAVLPQFTVFVLLSRYEGAPYTVMEAMSQACACVVTDVVGSRDLIVDGESGVLVPPEDPETAARVVGDLLADAGHRSELGTAARRRVAESFTADGMAEETVRLYEALSSLQETRRTRR